MQQTFKPVRLAGFAILAVATATTLSVGACSKSHDEKAPAKPSAPASAKGGASVSGMVASVSGNSVQVTEPSGTATVDVSPSTKVFESSKGQLTDIAAGNCVSVDGKFPAPGGAVTAIAVHLVPAGGDGKCPQPKNLRARSVVGTVASVAGNTIHVSVTDANGNPSQTEVTVGDPTRYSKTTPATTQAIAQGKCITAHGSKGGGGTLQATRVTVGASDNGQCPQPAGEQHPH